VTLAVTPQSHLSPRAVKEKIHHGGTEITEKRRMARFARQTNNLTPAKTFRRTG
jgi:hypothetical protein